MASALLLDEPCLVIQPALVRALGHLSDAAILQQTHYWIQRSSNEIAGHRWVYKTYDEWADEIGISEKQARSAIRRLEALGLLISCQPDAYRRTKWYRIDYDSPILADPSSAQEGASRSPGGQMDPPRRADGSAQEGRCIRTETTAESTQEITTSPTMEIARRDPEAEQRLSDCQRLADLLADLIEANGAQRPRVSQRWIQTLDRMIRIDGRSSEQIDRAIRWATSHDFWASNVLSPDALRRHFDRMALQARRDAPRARGLDGVRDYLAGLD